MENKISKTLFISLYFRALDALDKNSFLKDELALKIIKDMDFNDEKLKKARFSRSGTILRAKYFDDEAKKFISKNPNCVVVNMACGLDTRTLRIYSEDVNFFDIDLAEVIKIRKNFIKDKSNLISADILKGEFLEFLLPLKNRKFCFVFEGFFIFFQKYEIMKILNLLSENFSGLILADFIFGDFWEKNQSKHDALNNNEAKFKTSFSSLDELLVLNPKLKLLSNKYYHDKEFAKIFGAKRWLMKLMPKKMKNSSQLLKLEF